MFNALHHYPVEISFCTGFVISLIALVVSMLHAKDDDE